MFFFDESIDGSILSVAYEQSLSKQHKNSESIYYTPAKIIDKFFEYLPNDCSNLTFCDPCCGTGNYLVAALNHGFKVENIYGFDTDKIAIKIAQKRIFEITGKYSDNISINNFLNDDSKLNFDVILTNPPWGKKIRKAERDRLANKLSSGKSKDTSALFFMACINHLKVNGYLGLLLQAAFFNIGSFEDVRKNAIELSIKAFIDFGRPFSGVLSKAKGIILQNNKVSDGNVIKCESKNEYHFRYQKAFIDNPKLIFNFGCTQEDNDIIKHLFSIEHTTLAGQATWGLGIKTGNNKKYCISHQAPGYIPIYRGKDITKDGVNSPSTFIPSDLSIYQHVSPIELYQARNKLIYRFVSSKLVFFNDTKQRLLLNSANMLIPNEDFPINTKQLADILNSEIVGWLFETIFETNKVLRSDIESLPIHFNYFNTYDKFSEKDFLDYLSLERMSDGTFRLKK